MENSSDSLDICSKQCKSRCCKSTPPALTCSDIRRIEKETNTKLWKKTVEYNQKRTWVVSKGENPDNCFFLSEEGYCEVYDSRPLDCKLFPLFVKIKKQDENEYKVKWLVWYCPLTESKTVEDLYVKAKDLLVNTLRENPDEIFKYQESMFISGGYKRKHFFKEECLKI